MEEPISEGEITAETKANVTESTGMEAFNVFENTPYLINLEELLNLDDDDTHWYFGVGGPA